MRPNVVQPGARLLSDCQTATSATSAEPLAIVHAAITDAARRWRAAAQSTRSTSEAQGAVQYTAQRTGCLVTGSRCRAGSTTAHRQTRAKPSKSTQRKGQGCRASKGRKQIWRCSNVYHLQIACHRHRQTIDKLNVKQFIIRQLKFVFQHHPCRPPPSKTGILSGCH